ncbi:hypothetical protein GIB67_035830, partial [Kingdonia uniflora]
MGKALDLQSKILDSSWKDKADSSNQSYADVVKGEPTTIIVTINLILMICQTQEEVASKFPLIKIPYADLERGLTSYKFSLVGRMDLYRITYADFKIRVPKLWKLKGNCSIIPLGRGHFIIKLDSDEDKNYVWTRGPCFFLVKFLQCCTVFHITRRPWYVESCLIRLQRWSPNFNPKNHKGSNALMCVRFLDLSLEYWNVQTLIIMSKALGTPITIDNAARSQSSNFFASVLVDIDLSQPIPSEIIVEQRELSFGK